MTASDRRLNMVVESGGVTRVLLGLLAAFAAVVLASCESTHMASPGSESVPSFAQVGSGKIAEMKVDDPAQSGIDYKLVVVPPREGVRFTLRIWPGTDPGMD